MSPESQAALKALVDGSNCAQVAKCLGVSRTVVSLAVRGKYSAVSKTTTAFEQRLWDYLKEQLKPALEAAAVVDQRQWLDVLRAESQRIGQARLALRLDIAESTLSQVLSGSYKAATTRIERRVRGVLLGEEVDCRAQWGAIPMQACQALQEGPKPTLANPFRYHAWMSCRGMGRWEDAGPCPHFNCGGKPAAPATSKEDA